MEHKLKAEKASKEEELETLKLDLQEETNRLKMTLIERETEIDQVRSAAQTKEREQIDADGI